jgi:HK97 family phage portal protein
MINYIKKLTNKKLTKHNFFQKKLGFSSSKRSGAHVSMNSFINSFAPFRYDLLAEDGYHKNVIVYRCINLIMRGISSVPWLLYKKSKDQDHEEEILEHPLLSLLNCPSPKHAGSAFMESVVGHLLLSGNAYIEMIFNHSAVPQELHVLRPDRVNIISNERECSRNIPLGFEYRYQNQCQYYPVDPITGRSRLIHLKLFHPLNDWYGMSPLEAAKLSIDQHNTVSLHNLSILLNGGRPSGALMIKQQLTDQQRNILKDDLTTAYEGSKNAGRLLVLEGDMDWKELGFSPKDLDFVSGKQVSAREIAQSFGIPPMLVGVLGDATFANYREARFHLWEDTILPFMEFLLSEFNLWITSLFEEQNFKLRLDYDSDSIPALSSRRESSWQNMISAHFLTVNEKRAALGYGPINGGDTLHNDVNRSN